MPVFSTFIGPEADAPVTKRHDLWNDLIPHDRLSAAGSVGTDADGRVTYGDYFSAAQTFLTENNHHNLLTGLSRILQRPLTIGEIRTINLHLLKHGRFYHPARVVVEVGGQRLSMVLNVAVSEEGRDTITSEFDNLKRLEAEFPISFLPKAYAFGRVVERDSAPVFLFLGEWFDDYHEFHLSLDSSPDSHCSQPRIVVWNDAKEQLNHRQTFDVIQKASMILTFYYNPETFEQIFPWHHAAGDFVVRVEEGGVSLKLITVRGYSPLSIESTVSNSGEDRIEKIFEALLLFLLQLSFRMRLDRLDGTGDLVFHSEKCIPAIVNGFFQGLDLIASMRGYPDDFCTAVKTYLNSLAAEQLADYGTAYASRHMNAVEDGIMMNSNPEQHMQILREALET